jgi:hypothetical protein
MRNLIGRKSRVALSLLLVILSTALAIQVQTALASPTNIYHIATVCDGYKFQNTGNNIIYFNVEMPESRSSAWIYVSGQSYGDIYTRLFELYVNGVKVSGQQYPYDHFSYSWNILSYVNTGSNTIGIKLTTYIYSPGYNQYWLVSCKINVQYTASQHTKTSKSWFAPYVKFRNTAYNILNFTAAVPNGLASGSTIQVSGTAFGDIYSRRLDVFVNDQAITPSGGVVVGPSTFTWTSGDLTSRLTFQKTVKVGVRLTTYEYQSGYCWRVSGALTANSRYDVWPDTDNRWGWNTHAIGNGEATMYDTQSSDHENQFLGPTSFEIKASKEQDKHPIFYAGVMTHISDAMEDKYDLPWWVGINVGLFLEQEIHISIKDSAGNPVLNSQYFVREGDASPTDTGVDYYGIGSDMLAIVSAVAGAVDPLAGIPPAIASVLIKYLPNSGLGFSYGKETSTQGVYLTDHRGVLKRLSDLLIFDVDFPAIGTYTISFKVTVAVYNMVTWYWGGGTSYLQIAQNTFDYAVQYYYGP